MIHQLTDKNVKVQTGLAVMVNDMTLKEKASKDSSVSVTGSRVFHIQS